MEHTATPLQAGVTFAARVEFKLNNNLCNCSNLAVGLITPLSRIGLISFNFALYMYTFIRPIVIVAVVDIVVVMMIMNTHPHPHTK